MTVESIPVLLEKAVAARQGMLDTGHKGALRLFNGFLEGCPELVVDLYGRTLVLQDYAEAPIEGQALIAQAQAWLQSRLPWLQAGIVKVRNGSSAQDRNGRLVFGDKPDRKVQEEGVWYSLDLCMHQDASLYLDTHHLRTWARQALGGKTVLNTFAYTGSLGVAALAGGASRVVQLDLNRSFLNLAGISQLNQILTQTIPIQAKVAALVGILNQCRFLVILDNFESCLDDSRTGIADAGLKEFVTHLLNTTVTNTKYIITTRYDFDPLDGRLMGAIEHLSLAEMPSYQAV